MDINKNIDKNIETFNEMFSNCDDIIRREMLLGNDKKVKCFVAYIEVAVDFVVGFLINKMWNMPADKIYDYIIDNGLGVSDVSELDNMTKVESALLGGNAVLFIDGYCKGIKLSCDGYPSLGVLESESEKAVRGSKEAFSDSVKANASLLRKRIRSQKLKVKEVKLGVRSNTITYIVYMEGIAKESIISEAEKRLDEFKIDGIFDTGMIEQLLEKKWYSPFPQFQTTERPDRASMAVLEGRVLILTDNSPSALILPVNYNNFIQTSDDYYSRWEIVSFNRILRYIASFLAMILPGLYLAATNYHTQLLPTTMILSFAAARTGVPFSGVVEILLMEIAFELLREAGVRLPGTMGNTIGIVGGLIIGQAAVDANIISPIVVIIVALTALCSFAIPNEEFATAFRIIKFFLIFCGSWLGLYGMALGVMAVMIHLSHIESFNIPYLMPFVGAESNDYNDLKDSLIRWPAKGLNKRTVVANEEQRIKLRIKK